MAEKYDLDLDALAPESKKVKLNGRIIEVNPPKFKNLVALMKLANTMGEGDGGQTIETVDALRQSLIPLIPALGEEDFDLTMEQLNTLLQFVMTIATPQDQTTLEKQGYSVGEITTEKKTEDSPE